MSAVGAGLLGLLPSLALAPALCAQAPAPRDLCFRGRPLPACRSYVLTEWTWAIRIGDTPDGYGANSYWTW